MPYSYRHAIKIDVYRDLINLAMMTFRDCDNTGRRPLGKRGAKESLPESLREREFPSDRLPLVSLVGDGIFPDS